MALLAGLMLYLPNLRIGLVADDYIFLAQASSHPHLSWFATSGGAGVSFYRPLSRQLYFLVASRLFRSNPLPFHIVSPLLYIACAALVGLIASQLAGSRAGPVAALIFLGQHAGSVLTGWACCVQDLLALVFTLGALHFHLKGRRGLPQVLFLAALLSKETAVVFPALVWLVESRGPASGDRRKALPYLLILGLWAVGYAVCVGGARNATQAANVFDLTATPGHILDSLRLSLLAVLNLEEGLSISVRPIDILRGALAVLCGAGSIMMVMKRSPETVEMGGSSKSRVESRRGRNSVAPVRRPKPQPSWPVFFGCAWALLALLPLLGLGHRWSAYLDAMLAAAIALAAGAFLQERRRAAMVIAMYLLGSGPLADSASGGANESGVHSLHTLARLRRLSAFSGSLKGYLGSAHPTLPPGATILLSQIPEMSLVALHGSDAIQVWYGDPSLRMAFISDVQAAGYPEAVYILNYDCGGTACIWREEQESFVKARVRLRQAILGHRNMEVRDILEGMRRLPDWSYHTNVWQSAHLVVLGQAHMVAGDSVRAGALFREAVRLNSESGPALRALGTYQYSNDDMAGAEMTLAMAARILPQDGAIAGLLGVALARNGRDSGIAIRWLRHGLELGIARPSQDEVVRCLRELEKHQVLRL